MTKRSVVLVTALGIALVAASAVAWQSWRPLLRYQEGRSIAAARTSVRRYLDGKDSLDTAAHRLAEILRQWDELAFRTEDAPAPVAGSMVIESLEITPPGVSANDPRVEELFLNAMRLSTTNLPLSPEFKAFATANLDSVIRARGHRIVK